MAYLKAGVGEGFPNRKSDVTTVQILLNKWIVPGGVPVVRTALDVDGLFGPKTGFAIISFKLSNFLEFPALNHIQPRSSTLSKLDGPLPSHLFPTPADGPAPKTDTSRVRVDVREIWSGPQTSEGPVPESSTWRVQ